MNEFTESSITLHFPDDKVFRFSECKKFYAPLSAHFFKEMDICWYDTNGNIYWLIELKDFSKMDETIDSKVWDMVKKAVDSLCMLLSNKHDYEHGRVLNQYLPYHPDFSTEFKFVIIVHCSESQKPNMPNINDLFKTRFKSYATLFGIKHYAVLEHSLAIKYIPNNIVR